MTIKLDEKVFSILAEQHKTKDSDIFALIGKHIAFERPGHVAVIGEVLKTEGNNVYFKVIKHPFQAQTGYENDEGVAELWNISCRVNYEFLNETSSFMTNAYKVQTCPPPRILIKNNFGLTEFSYHNSDPDLNNILKNIQKNVGDIETINKLKELTHFVHSNFPFTEPNKRPKYDEKIIPLGKVVQEYGAVCRHVTGIEFGYLTLQNIKSKIIGSAEPIEQEAHSFLCVQINEKDFLVDPRHNFVFLMEEARESIEKIGKSKWHFPHKEYSLKFDYDYFF